MVDVGQKPETSRLAVARGRVEMSPHTVSLIREGRVAKGDPLVTARLAGIMAAKRTSEWIPLCHPLLLDAVEVDLALGEDGCSVSIEARVRCTGRTGVEMEALTAVAAAGLTLYDMCKAVDKGMSLTEVRLMEKRGGRSGTFQREE